MADYPTRCDTCGRFISFEEITKREAKFEFIPDSEFGPEEMNWTCAECAKKAAEIERLRALVIERDADRVRLTAELEPLVKARDARREYQREQVKASRARRKEGKG